MILGPDIIDHIETLVVRYFSSQYRDDARQDIYLALLSDELTVADLERYIGKQIRRNEGNRYLSVPISRAAVESLTDEDVNYRYLTLWVNKTVAGSDGRAIRNPSKYESAKALFIQGASVRHVKQVVGLSMTTVNRYRKMALEGQEIFCECGNKAGHRGWCAPRYQRSPKRQEWMKQWNGSRKQASTINGRNCDEYR